MRRPICRFIPLIIAGSLYATAQPNLAESELAFDAALLRLGEHQLFLDDYILGDLNGVIRMIHQPRKYGTDPILRADLPTDGNTIQTRNAPAVIPRKLGHL